MRWTKKKEPVLRDERNRVVFAWLPTDIADKWIWLEKYSVFERYLDSYNTIFNMEPSWVVVDKSLLPRLEK